LQRFRIERVKLSKNSVGVGDTAIYKIPAFKPPILFRGYEDSQSYSHIFVVGKVAGEQV